MELIISMINLFIQYVFSNLFLWKQILHLNIWKLLISLFIQQYIPRCVELHCHLTFPMTSWYQIVDMICLFIKFCNWIIEILSFLSSILFIVMYGCDIHCWMLFGSWVLFISFVYSSKFPFTLLLIFSSYMWHSSSLSS